MMFKHSDFREPTLFTFALANFFINFDVPEQFLKFTGSTLLS